MLMQKRAGIDLDGTLFNFDAKIRQNICREFGVDIPEGSPSTEYLFESCPTIKEKIPFLGWFDYFHENFILAGMYRNLQPYPHAKEAMQYLKSLGYDLVIITSRGSHLETLTDNPEVFKRLEQDTHDSVQEYFPNCFSDVMFKPRGITKGQICRDLKCRALIEDSIVNLDKAIRYVHLPILLDMPYNQTQETLENNRNGDMPVIREPSGVYRLRDLSLTCLVRLPL